MSSPGIFAVDLRLHARESEGRMYFHDNLGSAVRRGFTLVEILVVLILMGLMAGLVAPSIIGTRESDDPASQLRELIRSASAAAVKRGEVVQLSIASAGQWELIGTASSPPDEIASGRLKSSGTAMTLLFSPLGTCAPDLRSGDAAAALALDPIMCDFPAERTAP